MAKRAGMMGRLTLVVSRELDQAADAVRDVARFLSRTDAPHVAAEATVETAAGELEGPLRTFFELSEQVSRAAATHSHEAKTLRDMLKTLEELAQDPGNTRFHPALQTFQSLCHDLNALEENSPTLKWKLEHYSHEFEKATLGGPTRIQDSLEEDWITNGNSPLAALKGDARKNVQVKLKVQEITTPDFINRVVLPYVFNGSSQEGHLSSKATLVHEIDTGRATVAYHAGGNALAFGKLYTNRSQALHSFQIQSELWNLGFDGRGAYRVPEPFAYFPQYRLELMRAVEGRQLSTLFDNKHPEFPTYARQAARWLVKLHHTPLRVGQAENLWQSLWFCKILRRLTKATAEVPERRDEMVGMVHRLCDLAQRNLKDVPLVQAHGTFHYEHVLVEGATTSVIDFDRSFPSDPSKDLAEFLSVLRWKSFQKAGSASLAEKPSKAFLEEYLRYFPENSANLAVHWSADVLRGLFRQLKHHRGDETYEARIRFLKDEFDLVTSGKMLPRMGVRVN